MSMRCAKLALMRVKAHKEKTPLSDDRRITIIIDIMHKFASEGHKYYIARMHLESKGFDKNLIKHASYIVSYSALLKKYEKKPDNEILKAHFRKYPEDAAIYAGAEFASFEDVEEELDGIARLLVRIVFRTPGLNQLSIPVQMVTQLTATYLGDRNTYRKYRDFIIGASVFAIVFGFLIFVILPASTVGDGFWF